MIEYLSLEEFAERVGKSFSTMRGYLRSDEQRRAWHLLPEPDAVTGKTGPRPRYGWLPETCDGWVRVGQGTRTDLRADRPPTPDGSTPSTTASTTTIPGPR
ncbi:hypothetical protein ACWDSJ_27745 [Nocardia sp. NPDC003482]